MNMPEISNKLTLVTDSEIPIKLITDSASWKEILLNNFPFIITAIIVLAAAVVTYRSNRSSVESQNALADRARREEHENKISEFRHSWLNEVRETVADLCQAIYELQTITLERNLANRNLQQAEYKGDITNANAFKLECKECYERLVNNQAYCYRLFSKLKLLFKKEDSENEAAFDEISQLINSVSDFEKKDMEEEKIEKIVVRFQDILKTEWEATKDRTWKKNDK